MILHIEDFRVSTEERKGLKRISINFTIYWFSQDGQYYQIRLSDTLRALSHLIYISTW